MSTRPNPHGLHLVPAGATCRIGEVALESEHRARLAGLGISEGREALVERTGEPIVVKVYGSRIGIARMLAEKIQVTRDAPAASSTD